MKAILELENLSIGFNRILAREINAILPESSLTAVMGINGIGKSCLIKTLCHLIPPKSGNIKLDSRNYKEYSPKEFASMVSIVLTEKFQLEFLRVDELVALGRTPFTNWLGQIKPSDLKIINESMELVGIVHLADHFFSELSDGQKQKVLIARALAQKPKVLILDEPTTYLDIPSKIELMRLLKKIAYENKISVLFSSHDLDLVEKYVDHIWLMGNSGEFFAKSSSEMKTSGLLAKYFHLNLN